MLIITDLDDTLLPSDNVISEYTIEVLKKLQKLNHKIVFNTARSLTATLDIYSQFKPDYLILNGGSSIYNNNLELLYEKRITLTTTLEIINYLKTMNIHNILIECGDGFLTESLEILKRYSDVRLIDFHDIKVGALKIVYEDSTNNNAEFIKNTYQLDVTNYVGGKLHKVSCNNKAIGNRILLELLNDNSQKTICFGDDLGDIQMLLEADFPVRMQNSQPELFKYNFDETLVSNNFDGVAKYLARKILKEG